MDPESEALKFEILVRRSRSNGVGEGWMKFEIIYQNKKVSSTILVYNSTPTPEEKHHNNSTQLELNIRSLTENRNEEVLNNAFKYKQSIDEVSRLTDNGVEYSSYSEANVK